MVYPALKSADLEREHILRVLQKTGWRCDGENGAVVPLGINPSTLRARMHKYEIRRDSIKNHRTAPRRNHQIRQIR